MPEQAGLQRTWPFPVRQPIEEVLEWRTDVLAARAAEQRIALRPAPREILSYTHVLDAAGIARATELARAGFTGSWLVPLWSMTVRPGINLADTDTVIPMDTTLGDWRGPGHAIVATDGGEAHAIEIADVFPDRLELVNPVGIAVPNALVAPARIGQMTAPVEITRRRHGLGTVAATFTLTDAAGAGASPYLSYQSLDVVTDPTVLRQPLSETVARTVDIVDNGFGPLVLEPVRDALQRRSSLTLVDHGLAARWTRRQWLMSLRGRQSAVWLPSWGRELVLQAPVGAADTSIVVAPIADLTAYVARHVMIDLPTGLVFREITGAVFDALGHRLDIAAPGVAVPIGTPVHFLTKVRLDADRVELTHSATRTEMSVAVIEVPG